jgi:hypothetical protein
MTRRIAPPAECASVGSRDEEPANQKVDLEYGDTQCAQPTVKASTVQQPRGSPGEDGQRRNGHDCP